MDCGPKTKSRSLLLRTALLLLPAHNSTKDEIEGRRTSVCQFISDTSHSLDIDRSASQFPAQMGDVNIHGAGLSVEIESPRLLEKLLAGEDAPGLPDQDE